MSSRRRNQHKNTYRWTDAQQRRLEQRLWIFTGGSIPYPHGGGPPIYQKRLRPDSRWRRRR